MCLVEIDITLVGSVGWRRENRCPLRSATRQRWTAAPEIRTRRACRAALDDKEQRIVAALARVAAGKCSLRATAINWGIAHVTLQDRAKRAWQCRCCWTLHCAPRQGGERVGQLCRDTGPTGLCTGSTAALPAREGGRREAEGAQRRLGRRKGMVQRLHAPSSRPVATDRDSKQLRQTDRPGPGSRRALVRGCNAPRGASSSQRNLNKDDKGIVSNWHVPQLLQPRRQERKRARRPQEAQASNESGFCIGRSGMGVCSGAGRG